MEVELQERFGKVCGCGDDEVAFVMLEEYIAVESGNVEGVLD